MFIEIYKRKKGEEENLRVFLTQCWFNGRYPADFAFCYELHLKIYTLFTVTYWLAWLLTSAISQLGSDRLKAHTLVITKTTVLLVIIKSRVSSITSRCSKNEPLFREGRIPDSRKQWNSSLELLRLTTQYFRRILLWINVLKRHDVYKSQSLLLRTLLKYLLSESCPNISQLTPPQQ